MNIQEQLADIYNKISVMAGIQHVLMDKLADNDPKLQAEIMAITLSNNGFRNSFTDFAFNEGNEDLKEFVTGINMMLDMASEEE